VGGKHTRNALVTNVPRDHGGGIYAKRGGLGVNLLLRL